MVTATFTRCDHYDCQTLADGKCAVCDADICQQHTRPVALRSPVDGLKEYGFASRGLCFPCEVRWLELRGLRIAQRDTESLVTLMDPVFEGIKAVFVEADLKGYGSTQRSEGGSSQLHEVANLLMSSPFGVTREGAYRITAELTREQLHSFLGECKRRLAEGNRIG